MSSAGFEIAIPASGRWQTYSLDRTVTEFGSPACVVTWKNTTERAKEGIKILFIQGVIERQIYLNWLSERPDFF